jgi:hypothetical protein
MTELTGFRAEQFSIAVDTGPISVDERHGIAADRAVGWRTLVKKRKIRELDIVFVHDLPILPVV